ncbi:MAG: M15 family metallopeptidase [bacterium]
MKTIPLFILLLLLLLLPLPLLPATVAAQSGNDELVAIKEFIPDIVLDLKYNTLDNFTDQKLYTTDECLLSRAAVQGLILVQDSLRNIRQHNGIAYPQGIGIKIWDGYRPRAVQFLLWEIFPVPGFVANPHTGSNHNRGAAVDVTLVDLATGAELEMPTPFDDFTERASHNFNNLPANVLANRALLKNMMQQIGGFSSISTEWWHYNFGPARPFPLVDFQLK